MRLKSNPPKRKSSSQMSLKSRINNQAMKTETVSYPNRFITTLEEIQYFPNIIHLNLSDNCIQEHQQFRKILNPFCLQTLIVKGNPLCQQINYAYPFLSIFPNIQKIDDIQFANQKDKQQLVKSQQQLGDLIIKLLYLKSSSGFFECFINNIENIHDQNHNHHQMLQKFQLIEQVLMRSFQTIKSQAVQKFYFKNFVMKRVINAIITETKSNILIPANITEKIRSYWLQQMLSFSAKNVSQDGLIVFLLDKVHICPEKSIQEQFLADPKNCKDYIESLLYEKYVKDSYQGKAQAKHSKSRANTCRNGQKNNFLSVQTNDTCSIDSCKNMFHFCLDQRYVNTSFQVLELHLVDFMQKIDCLKKQINGTKQINDAKIIAQRIHSRNFQSQKPNVLQLTFQPSNQNSIWKSFLSRPSKPIGNLSIYENSFKGVQIKDQSEAKNELDAYQIHSNFDLPLQVRQPKQKTAQFKFTQKQQNCQNLIKFSANLNNLFSSGNEQLVNQDKYSFSNSEIWQDKFIVETFVQYLNKLLICKSFSMIKHFTNRRVNLHKAFKKIEQRMYEVKRYFWIKLIFLTSEDIQYESQIKINANLHTPKTKYSQQVLSKKRRTLLKEIIERKKHVEQNQARIALGRWKQFVAISKIREIARKQMDLEPSLKKYKSQMSVNLQYNKIVKKYKLK